MYVIYFIAGLFLGACAGWFLAGVRLRAVMTERMLAAEGNAKAAAEVNAELRRQMEQGQEELDRVRAQLAREQEARVKAETALVEARNNLDEQKQLLAVATDRLADTFKSLSADALRSNNQSFLQLAGQALENVVQQARGDLQLRQEAIDGLIKPLKEELVRYGTQVRAMENIRQEAYGSLQRQLEELSRTHRQLQKETGQLVGALKSPQVRGRWGEITLRRVVEVAGMSPYCDFTEQVSLATEDGRKRPDLVVKLPGGRTVVVDAKVPLQAYMEALEAGDDSGRRGALLRHAQSVRVHMQSLGSKAYWSQFTPSPDFVVLFLPGESFFSAALEQDRSLIEDGVSSRVILTTPTTLIALLRTVALSWQQQQMAENARLIAQAGAGLYERLCIFAGHLVKIHDGLNKAVQSYNSAVGSWEGRVVPGVRKLKELGAGVPGRELAPVVPVETSLRQPAAE
ncbi:DNA recombination protein RmuC [Desulfotomaculum copahuensis]|uniref:Recombinase RmuC n=1 Tax=Desulfotomaculum copahuensis TaxID=1838280 RepID=A0A1B7LAQ1_9FIRM|nr:DNA recombination protein RmuC [Desulfotomaculum copahuensis]OAT79405.1 recombinase RmuC [Desulfotomaculum copahuensis]